MGEKELTNLLELLFLTVFALPKASSRGLDSRITAFTLCGEGEERGRGGRRRQKGINYPVDDMKRAVCVCVEYIYRVIVYSHTHKSIN